MGTRRLRGSSACSAALDWNGDSPFLTAGKDEQASTVTRAGWWKAGRDQGSPLRRCFKPRPPLSAGCAGFASGCRSSGFGAQAIAGLKSVLTLRSRSGRLSGLLSGCPPTDTRPQARAKLGNYAHKRCASALQEFFFQNRCRRYAARSRRGQDAALARPNRVALIARGEWLDLLGAADEGDHHRDAAEKEQALHDVHAVGADVER